VQKDSRKLEEMMEKWLIVQGFRNEVRQMGHNSPDPEMGVSQNFDQRTEIFQDILME
jgi:hypothetical protein